MLELFIEGNKLDINEEFSMLMTYAIDDIKDFGAKNTTFSKTVILPGTKNNNKLFGNIFDASVSNDYNPSSKNIGINFNASVSASVVVFNNNIQVMKGILQLLEIVYDDSFIEYEVGLFGELAGFTAKLGASKLEDLDFSAYDHTYSIANIVASKSNVGNGSGYLYPLIDYGTYGRNSTHSAFGKHSWMYGTFRPALFVKEYIDKIFTGTGYTYDCDLFNSTRFKGLVVPHNQKYLSHQGYSNLNVNSNSYTLINSDFGTSYRYYNFVNIVNLELFDLSNNQEIKYIGVYQPTQTVIFSIPLNYKLSSNMIGELNIMLNGSAIYSYTFINNNTIQTPILNYTYSGNLNTNDIFKIEYRVYQGGSGVLVHDVTLRSAIVTHLGTVLQSIQYILGKYLPMNNFIPSNILQKDFISSICKLFNLYVYEDPSKDKHLKISPFVDFFYLAGSIDWTYKLDRSKPIKLKPMSELTARYYLFEYKKDSDYWNDLYNKRYNLTYGSYKYDSNYQLSQESQTVEIIFSGTPIVGYQGEDKIYSSIFKRTGTDIAPVEETTDSNIRILQTKLVTGVASWDILADNGTTVLGSYTDYPYAGHFDDPDAPTNDLCFGVPNELFFTLLAGSINVNQFNLYWSSYLAEITDKDAKLLTGTFKLAFKDINNLDFSKYIYIDGSLWRLNKIIDFNATQEDTCTVELVKVINKLY